jgi:GNAT superfamily N-acetyltransferase
MYIVRHAVTADAIRCRSITAGLTDHFSSEDADKIAADLTDHESWIVARDDVVVGFGVVDRRSDRVAEILWLAIEARSRRRGLGTTLLDAIATELAATGVRTVEVKTLDASAGYPPYEGTRRFWESHGFVQVDTVDPMPGWRPGNPAAGYVTTL